jgi:serine/threonine protein kinase
MNDSSGFLSRYDLIKPPFGTGGFAEVYRAYDKDLKQFVAVKMIIPGKADDPKFLGLLKDEASLTRKLDHPNIVKVYNVEFDDSNKQLAIIMQYIQGADLAKFIHKLHEQKCHIPVPLALYIISEVCQALDYAHHHAFEVNDKNEKQLLRIIHRDVSPQNIMITQEGEVKVIDFGIAKGNIIRNVSSADMQFKGKFNYASPEHFKPGKMDHRSDIFSLGAVLYEALTSEKLFDSPYTSQLYAEICEKAISQQKFESGEIPEEIERIIKKAAEREIDKRYQSAGEMSKDIDAYLIRIGSKSELRSQLRKLLAGLSFDDEKGQTPRPVTPVTPLPTPITISPAPKPPDPPTKIIAKKQRLSNIIEKSKQALVAFQPMLVRLKMIVAQTLPKLRRVELPRRAMYIFAAGAALLLPAYFLIKLFSGPAPMPHAITLQTIPPGATVIVNGKILEGVTPLTLEAGPSDTLNLQFTFHGLPDLHKTLRVAEMREAGVSLVFPINLQIASIPQNAKVLIDDSLWKQPTPAELLWEIDKPLHLELQTAGFPPLKNFAAEWLPDWEHPKMTSEVPEFWKMTPPNDQSAAWVIEGTFFKAVRLNSIPPRAEIFHGKKSMGLTNRDTLRLVPGNYSFTLRKQGYRDGLVQLKVDKNTSADPIEKSLARQIRVAATGAEAPQIVFVANEKDEPIEFRLVRSGGREERRRLTWWSEAAEYVATPAELILDCAPHRLTVAKRGYLDQTIEIDALSNHEVAVPALRKPPEGFKVEVVEAGANKPVLRGTIFYRQVFSRNRFSEGKKKFGDLDAFGTHTGALLQGDYQFKVENCPGYKDSDWSETKEPKKGKSLKLTLRRISQK